MSRRDDFDNEKVIRHIWKGLHGDDSDGYMGVAYPDLADIFEYEEMRNRVIDQARKEPAYIEKAFFDINDGVEEDSEDFVPVTVFDPSAMKERDLDFSHMSLEDVNAMSNAMAKALGYADNGEELGAYRSAARALAGDDRKKLAAAVREKLKPETRREFLMAIGLNPDIADTDGRVVDRVLDYFGRSGQAEDYAGTNPAAKFGLSLLAPYSFGAYSEGRAPTVADGLADGVMLFPAGYRGALKLANLGVKGLGKFPVTNGIGKGIGAVARGAGMTEKGVGKGKRWANSGVQGFFLSAADEAIDALHDTVDDWLSTKTYETGDHRREESKGLWDALGDNLKFGERFQRAALTGPFLSVMSVAGIDKAKRGIGHLFDKASDWAEKRGIDFVSKGNRNKMAAAKRKKTNAEKRLEEKRQLQDLNDSEYEEFLKAERDPAERIRRTAEKKAMDRKLAAGMAADELKAMEAQEILEESKNRGWLRDSAGKLVNSGLDALGLKLHDQNVEIPIFSDGKRTAISRLIR